MLKLHIYNYILHKNDSHDPKRPIVTGISLLCGTSKKVNICPLFAFCFVFVVLLDQSQNPGAMNYTPHHTSTITWYHHNYQQAMEKMGIILIQQQ